MKNILLFSAAALLLPTIAEAELDLPDIGAYGKTPVLTDTEKKMLAESRKWSMQSGSRLAQKGTNGRMLFQYGAFQPVVLCATLQVTDISLQPGEKVNSVHSGDTARWIIEPAVTGSGENMVQHVIVKPMESGLETSLIVATDRRIYHMQLKSTQNDYVPRVSFIYDEDLNARFRALSAKQEKERRDNTMPTGEYLGSMDFGYTVTGDAPWKPLRVYNDGKKTIIQMPKSMSQTEAPTFLSLQDGKELMVNYRLQGDRFIIDSLFDKGMLIAGVGSRQTRVTIRRTNGGSR